jgi:hypothetical protein
MGPPATPRRSARGHASSPQVGSDATIGTDLKSSTPRTPKRKRGEDDNGSTPGSVAKRAAVQPSQILMKSMPPLPAPMTLTFDDNMKLLPREDGSGTTEILDLDCAPLDVPEGLEVDFFSFFIKIGGGLIETGIPTQRLLSTRSDMRTSILAEPLCPNEREEQVQSVLNRFQDYPESTVRTIIHYLNTSRFNSATHSDPPNTYTITQSIALLDFAVTHAMPRLVTIILAEMNREFYPRPIGHAKSRLTLTAAQLTDLSMLRDENIQAWLRKYIIDLFKTGPNEFEDAKKAYEQEIMKVERYENGMSMGPTMLQKIALGWFDEPGNVKTGPRGLRWPGDLGRLRKMRPPQKDGPGVVKKEKKVKGKVKDELEDDDPTEGLWLGIGMSRETTAVEERPAPAPVTPKTKTTVTMPATPTKKRVILKFKNPNALAKAVGLVPIAEEGEGAVSTSAAVPAPDIDTAFVRDNTVDTTTTLVDGAPVEAAPDKDVPDVGAPKEDDEDEWKPIVSEEEEKDYYERMEKARALHPMLLDHWRM